MRISATLLYMPRHHFSLYWKNIYLFLVNKNTDWKPKVLLALAVVYLIWPVDLAPDLIPFLGWLDDLGFGSLALWYLSRTAGKYLKNQDLKKK